MDKFHCLCNFRRLLYFCIGSVRIAEPQVAGNGTGEQHALLRNKTDLLPQFFQRQVTQFHAVQRNAACCDIVQTGNQVHQCGLAAAGAADDRRGLVGLCREAKVCQSVLLRMRIAEADMVKGQHALAVLQMFRLCCFLYRGLGLQHFVNTFGCHRTTGQHDGHHSQHQERHDDHHRIRNECSHRANLHRAAVNAVRTDPHDQNGQAVHDQHHHRHHEGHDTVDKQVGLGEVAVRLVEAFFLGLFPSERPNDGQFGQDLTGNQIHLIHQHLHFLELRHSDRHQHADDSQNYQHCQYNDPAHAGSGVYHFQNAANAQNRSIQQHSQENRRNHLHLLNIIGASGNQ